LKLGFSPQLVGWKKENESLILFSRSSVFTFLYQVFGERILAGCGNGKGRGGRKGVAHSQNEKEDQRRKGYQPSGWCGHDFRLARRYK
jgi:hypothetical protein